MGAELLRHQEPGVLLPLPGLHAALPHTRGPVGGQPFRGAGADRVPLVGCARPGSGPLAPAVLDAGPPNSVLRASWACLGPRVKWIRAIADGWAFPAVLRVVGAPVGHLHTRVAPPARRGKVLTGAGHRPTLVPLVGCVSITYSL